MIAALRLALCGLLYGVFCQTALAGDALHIAVASNFRATLDVLAEQFQAHSGHHVLISNGSTGKLYAQIRHGAPYDVFLSADSARPAQLAREGYAVAGSGFVYARGQLVLWSPQADLIDHQGQVLHSDRIARLAIANPKLAPYGEAAQQALQQLGLWDSLQARLVRGENIAQTMQFAESGNVDAALVALSQIRAQAVTSGSFWLLPATLYQPVAQQAILLKDRPQGRAFLAFLRSPQARQIIQAAGYAIAPDVAFTQP